MKKRYINIKAFLVATLLVSTSCDDYLDVNKDPNLPTIVPAHSRLVGAITTTNGASMWRGAREIAAVTQYASTANVATGTNRNAEQWRFTASYFFWQNAYVFTMPNCIDLIVLGEKEGNPHFVGAGKTLLALNYGMLTDQYGAIVVDDYYNGQDQINLTPKFNTQEEVYQRIQTLLDEAIAAFSSPDNKTPLNFSGGDIMYKGDVDKWKRFAWSLKARYMNHLAKKGNLYKPQEIIAAAQKGFNADGMDAEFSYLAGGQQTDENPWYSWGGFTSADRKQDRYFTWTQFYIDLLQNFPVTETDYQDPRISRIMTPAPDGQYRGLRSGLGLAGGQGGKGTFTTETSYGPFKNSGFYTRATSPFPFITYSEVKLIESEARLRSGDASGALAAYEEGVKANMRKLGVPAGEINAYWLAQLADGVALHFNNLTQGLSHIMRQKYITQTLNPETWVDMRRMDYSQAIYGPTLQRPANLNTVVFDANNPSQWIQAMVYETNEQNRNGENIGDNSERYRLLTPLWWNTQ
ncbi:hypothetical protein TH63_17835 [Rufibacter radiotolerans]|uniref:SusD/RagB family nutrient-binding outer membrane lipoprotein n=1 Tax=Rufibacter radiotolerans TaxID=1379910 RepID=A0A0H4VTF9_9BACT|nr:SusD/RagB family nutrient-binding outer membrane lipoprotein [Rufibacter radiotolerans]AKQ47079.1 hypothetical protein TH63_17835 [Rufibacter radiotolerans]